MRDRFQDMISKMKSECEYMRKRLAEGKIKLRRCKGRGLICRTQKESDYYSVIDPEKNEGRPIYKGLFHKFAEVQRIAAYHYFDRALKQVEKNIRILDKLSNDLVDVDPNVFLPKMPKAYRKQASFVYRHVGAWNAEDWQNRPWFFRDKMPHKKKLTTKNNWRVRSKAEEMWINSYYDRGIPHVYEAAHQIEDHWVDTDITALDTNDYQDILHEHNGMMGDPDYVLNIFIPKLHDYIKAGYIPGVNLILTYEFDDLPLSQTTVDATLDHYFGKI